MRFFDSKKHEYLAQHELNPEEFTCGHCNNSVASNQGFMVKEKTATRKQVAGIYICPSCLGPVFCDMEGEFHPKPTFGQLVINLPKDLEKLYKEARDCCGAGAYTASILSCRKILMHVAVDLGADTSQSFLKYVKWLHQEHHIPPNGRLWVDHIRKKGNEANHEIVIANQEDAENLIKFTEMLLKVNYEFPGLITSEQEE